MGCIIFYMFIFIYLLYGVLHICWSSFGYMLYVHSLSVELAFLYLFWSTIFYIRCRSIIYFLLAFSLFDIAYMFYSFILRITKLYWLSITLWWKKILMSLPSQWLPIWKRKQRPSWQNVVPSWLLRWASWTNLPMTISLWTSTSWNSQGWSKHSCVQDEDNDVIMTFWSEKSSSPPETTNQPSPPIDEAHDKEVQSAFRTRRNRTAHQKIPINQALPLFILMTRKLGRLFKVMRNRPAHERLQHNQALLMYMRSLHLTYSALMIQSSILCVETEVLWL